MPPLLADVHAAAARFRLRMLTVPSPSPLTVCDGGSGSLPRSCGVNGAAVHHLLRAQVLEQAGVVGASVTDRSMSN